MDTILLVIYLLAALGVIGLVLIQQGKGADMGASFGAGASNTVFGAGGSGNFLTRSTSIFALVFFVLSIIIGNVYTHEQDSKFTAPSLNIEQEVTPTNDISTDVLPAPQGSEELPQ